MKNENFIQKFDYITLNKFLEENQEFLSGARLQKIQQPTRQELIFNIRGNKETRKFYININPQLFHICFLTKSGEEKRHIEIPQKPPMFCMQLRKYLEGARIAKINQPEEERILEFYFETYNELSEKIYLCLAIELMGKHSNVILYNYDTNMILGCMHNIGAEKSSVREIIGGLPYAYPPKKKNLIKSGFSTLIKEDESVNDTIDNYFSTLQEKQKISTLKTKLLTSTNTKLKKVQNTISKINKQTNTEEKTNLYRKKGDLIMVNLFGNKDFTKEIEVFDYETNSPIKISLDETKSLKENANHFYKLYNKSKTANLKTEEMREKLKQEIEYLEQILYSLETATAYEEVLEINGEINPIIQNSEKKKKENNDFSKNILKQEIKKSTIFVGKNNKQNDYIVSKLSRAEDLWFHTHNCAGSHVLLRVEAGQEVTNEIIFECAKLAKEYSSAKNSSKVGIIYTKVKNLKKPPAAPLGYVIYKGEKEIIVD